MSARPERPRRTLTWSLVGLGLLVLVVVLLAVFMPRSAFDSRAPGAVVGGEAPDTRYVVTGAQPLAGTNFIQIDIGAGDANYNGGGSFSGSGGRSDRRNILLLDRTTGETRRLLPDNQRRIAQAYFLPAKEGYAAATASETDFPSGEGAPPPAYFVLLVAQAGQRDRFDLLVGSLAAPEQGFVMQGIEGVDGVWMQGASRIGVLARERLNLFYRIIDVPALRVIQSRRIAI